MKRIKRRLESFLFLATLAISSAASAATVTTVYDFNGTDGVGPSNGTLLYRDGMLYGTTAAGGDSDMGVVIAVSTAGSGTVLHSFAGTDGGHPNGSLVADAAGNLYGTTQAGGAANAGTIFKLTKPAASGAAWGFTLLHSFTGLSDGALPVAGLALGPDGVLYGTAYNGGSGSCGTVYRITTAGSFSVLRTFVSFYDSGCHPATNVVVDSADNVMGTTYGGYYESDGGGLLFKIAPGGAYTVVREFSVRGPLHGPIGRIARDSAGSIYGMAVFTGVYGNPPTGTGIFKVAGATHGTSILATFGTQASNGGISLDNGGVLYFTMTGSSRNTNSGTPTFMQGAGTVYALAPGGTPTPLASLDYGNLSPIGTVVADGSGNLWGQSSSGGIVCTAASNATQTGCGTIFKVTP